MTSQSIRSALWVILALLITAQSGAIDPGEATGSDTGTTEATQASETRHVGTRYDPLPADPVDTSQIAPAAWPSSNIVLPSGSDIAVIPVSGLIYDFTFESLERRVDKALAGGASLIVIELDTPGGVVTSALKISKYIKTLNVPTVAWVHNEAYSAGIMLAAACDEIVMAKSSATGDCAPIVPGMNLEPTERAKALSPILAEFRDSASTNGYDYAMFHAMCVLGVEVYLVEKDDGSGERRLVNQADYAVMVSGASPQSQPSATPTPTPASVTSPGTSLPVVNNVGAVTLSLATDADRGAWRAVEVLPSGDKAPGGRIHDGKTLLTLNQTLAQDIGLSKAVIGSEADLKQHYRAATVVAIPQTWSEGLAAVLTSGWVRIILIIVLLVGAYMEMQAPGLSVPGAVAAVALVLLIGAPFIIGLAEVWHILLFVLGFIFVVIELVLTPTFGVLGVIGLMMMFMGVVLSVVPSSGPGWLPPPEMRQMMLSSMFITFFGLMASCVGFYYITKHFGKIPGLNRLILTTVQPSAEAVGLDASGQPIHVSGDEVLGVGVIEVGHEGVVLTELRPSGMARFGGQQIDVVSVGPFVEIGDTVKVVEVHGNRIVVDKV